MFPLDHPEHVLDEHRRRTADDHRRIGHLVALCRHLRRGCDDR